MKTFRFVSVWLMVALAVPEIMLGVTPKAYFISWSTPPVAKMIDTATQLLAPGAIDVEQAPNDIAVSPDGSFVYVVNEDSSNVSVIQASDNTVVDTIQLSYFGKPLNIAITPDGAFAYVTVFEKNTVNVIRTSDNTIVDIIPLEAGQADAPVGIAITPDGAFAYVTSDALLTSAVTVIQTSDNTVFKTIGINADSHPMMPVVTPNGAYVYITTGKTDTPTVNGSLIVIDTVTQWYLNYEITVGWDPQGIAVTPNGDYVYVANANENSLSVIDTSNNSSSEITLSPSDPDLRPLDVAVTPDGLFLYVTCQSLGTSSILIFNTTYLPTLANTIDLGQALTPLAIDIGPTTPGIPTNFSGYQKSNAFLAQIELFNVITWTPPTTGIDPVEYRIYRDAALTDLIETIDAGATLEIEDHNRLKGQIYTYYIISVDAYGVSSPNAATIQI